ncbi:MAG: hypothetical protein GEU99_14175 [Luteitalea sp.]|nr:hypothetical protein [Luteitalea sp.]
MTLLVAAGLFIKSLMNVSRVDLGLTIDRLVTFHIAREQNGYTPERAHVLFERLEDELAAQPGVTSVTASSVPAIAQDISERPDENAVGTIHILHDQPENCLVTTCCS